MLMYQVRKPSTHVAMYAQFSLCEFFEVRTSGSGIIALWLGLLTTKSRKELGRAAVITGN